MPGAVDYHRVPRLSVRFVQHGEFHLAPHLLRTTEKRNRAPTEFLGFEGDRVRKRKYYGIHKSQNLAIQVSTVVFFYMLRLLKAKATSSLRSKNLDGFIKDMLWIPNQRFSKQIQISDSNLYKS